MLKKTSKKSRSKRSFLLFELLFSLALVALCLIPLIKPHIGIQKVERANLKQVELARLSQNAFCYLKTQLYEEALTFDELAHKDGVAGVLPFSFKSNFPREKEYICRYEIVKQNESTKKGTKNTGLLLTVQLYFDNEGPFFHTLYVERREKKG